MAAPAVADDRKPIACVGCGCLCDDVVLEPKAGGRTAVGACSLGQAWFDAPAPTPADWRRAGWAGPGDAALTQAVGLMAAAKAPLVYGLTRLTVDGQRAAAALADRLRAVWDVAGEPSQGGRRPSGVPALQHAGDVTCTLGEIKDRADLLVFWRVDPLTTHPRHFERYSVEPRGEFITAGRAGRKLIVVTDDPTVSKTAAVADEVIVSPAGGDDRIFAALRLLLAGKSPSDPAPGGVPTARWAALVDAMRTARFGVLAHPESLRRAASPTVGVKPTAWGGRDVSLETALLFLRDLNRHTCFASHAVGGAVNALGALNVAAWQAGFPFAVDFRAGHPRYSPGENDGPAGL
ncbi:MAG: formylmethanofuran dehydrogenase subunit B, partial [Planctomycetia bacterium]